MERARALFLAGLLSLGIWALIIALVWWAA